MKVPLFFNIDNYLKYDSNIYKFNFLNLIVKYCTYLFI